MTTDKDDASAKKFDDLMGDLSAARKKWQTDDEEEDDTDRLLQHAIDLAIQQGKGWSPGEKEEYLKKILADDFIPPMFASTQEELEKSGLAEAFSTLQYDDPPSTYMLECKKKGGEAFLNGKRNETNNVQYYRDAVNHYYEAFAWAQKIDPGRKDSKGEDEKVYTEEELDEIKSVLCSNAALAHMQLKNWGYGRNEAEKALTFNKNNVKAWYRLAKCHQMLQNWEETGDAIDSGLEIERDNKELKKLQDLTSKKVRKARQARQQRERRRAERVALVKGVWKHCKDSIRLGRFPLVNSVDDDEGEDDSAESRWHHHFPHSGELPRLLGGDWSWPCLFLYPSHNQSDFVKDFGESEMIAIRLAQMFPDPEDLGEEETALPWDHNNEFICSNLAVYFEVHCTGKEGAVVHPESVAPLPDQGSTMRFYEASRALRGDEGEDMAGIVRAIERKHLYKQRKAWIKKHGSLWAKPDPSPLIRVHPAMTLRDVLTDSRMIIPNFLVTFIVFPDKNPAHEEYLKEHSCVGIIQPKENNI